MKVRFRVIGLGIVTICVLLTACSMGGQDKVVPPKKVVPNLVGVEGMVILPRFNDQFYGERYNLRRYERPDAPWFIHPLKLVGPDNWDFDKSIKVGHKTKVKVVEQYIQNNGRGYADTIYGHLVVENDSARYRIEYDCFVAVDWVNDTMGIPAYNYDHYLATYNGAERVVDSGNEWVDVAVGDTVYVWDTDCTDHHWRRDNVPDTKKYSFGAKIYRDGGKYFETDGYFTPESLDIFY